MVQLAVPDALVPCLLGPKGATLRELMAYSGAAIKVGATRCFSLALPCWACIL